MLQFIISLLFTIVIARPEGQVNQEINEPDDLLAVENLISEVILPPPSTGTVEFWTGVIHKPRVQFFWYFWLSSPLVVTF